MAGSSHSYLFREGLWIAEGTYRDAEGTTYPVAGESRIRHDAEHWSIEASMWLSGDRKTAFVNNYRVVPFEPHRVDTTWTSSNPALGTMTGRFAVVEDVILSSFRSEDGRCRGSECLRQVNTHTYRGRGVLYRDEQLASCWAVNLTMSIERKTR